MPTETKHINLPVWPGLAPGETTASPGIISDDHGGNVTRRTDVTGAELFVFSADSERPQPMVLVYPGGGYDVLSTDLEGTEVAGWLQTLGFAAAVLHYRVPKNRDGALQDAQRAVSLLRARASEFGIIPDRLGVLGFSAGGHLALRLAAAGEGRAYERVDSIDDASCRPDFALAIYPAFLLDGDGQPMPEVRPNSAMPPVFLAQSQDDSHFCTPPYAEALAQAGVPVESRVYESGGHGYGVRLPAGIPAARWTADAQEWLLSRP